MVTASAAGPAPDGRSEETLSWFPYWLALIGSAVEVVVLYARKRDQPLVQLSEDFIWMAPLALLVVTLACVVPFRLLGSVRHTPRARSLALFVPAAAVFLNLLLLVPRLGTVAAGLLAVGLAVQTTRFVSRQPARIGRLVRQSTPWLLAGFVAAGSLMWASLRAPSSTPPPAVAVAAPPPNVVIITLDTVRAANLSLYGYGRRTTPHLDQFAARGVVFDQAFTTAPWTLPSHGSMFTGRWPHELSASYTTVLDGTHPTLAEYLGAHGYRTAGFAANLGYCSHETGLGRGFHHYEDYARSPGQIAASSTLVRTIADNFRLRRLIQNDQHLNRISAARINQRALDWLSARGSAPFFVFLNYFDAHEPYLPPPPYDRQFGPGRRHGRHSPLNHWLWNPTVAHGNMGDAERREEIDAYDGALAYLDGQVGELLDAFERRDLLKNTVVIITSDHGEEFGEHGVYDHGYSLYRAGLHVPFLVVAPGRVPVGQRLAAPVSLRDLAATVADLAGLKAGSPFPGTSLAGLWAPRAVLRAPDELPSPVLSEVSASPGQPDWFPSSKGPMSSLVVDGLRYIRNGDGREELYDLDRDPDERQDLAGLAEHQPSLAAARARLRALTSR
jgi:arylsulfatase A-like enzyme